MYAYLRGILAERDEEGIVLDCGGLGFDLLIGPVLAQQLGELGREITVYTHFHITQDNQQLYAFPDKESKKLFRLLITVSGIGPKVASNVLEVFDPAAFAVHVLKQDVKALTTVKGLGKKSAERIIVDLKDKLSKTDWAEQAKQAGLDEETNTAAENGEELTDASRLMQNDILEGLGYLGYQPKEAARLLKQSFDPTLDLEENLKRALAAARQV